MRYRTTCLQKRQEGYIKLKDRAISHYQRDYTKSNEGESKVINMYIDTYDVINM